MIFDLDGTLIDSASDISEAANFARMSYGYTIANPDYLSTKIGLPAKFLFEDLQLTEPEIKLLTLKFRDRLSQSIESGSRLFPGVLSFLKRSKEIGFHLSVATNKPNDLGNKVTFNSELRDLIDFTIGIGSEEPKPAPDMLIKCMNTFGTKDAIMFGDRVEDIRAAQAANAIAVGISQSTHSPSLLLESGALHVFANFSELKEYSEANDWRF